MEDAKLAKLHEQLKLLAPKGQHGGLGYYVAGGVRSRRKSAADSMPPEKRMLYSRFVRPGEGPSGHQRFEEEEKDKKKKKKKKKRVREEEDEDADPPVEKKKEKKKKKKAKEDTKAETRDNKKEKKKTAVAASSSKKRKASDIDAAYERRKKGN